MTDVLLPAGGEGEIFVSSPMLFSRYVGEQPAERWVSVGDMGRLGADGCLYLTGRKTRVIVSRSLKIHPEAIEALLATVPGIRHAAVVGLPDPLRGAIPVAVVEPETGAQLSRSMLAALCRNALGKSYCPRRFFTVERLPLTRSGKIASGSIQDALLSADASYQELR